MQHLLLVVDLFLLGAVVVLISNSNAKPSHYSLAMLILVFVAILNLYVLDITPWTDLRQKT